jgi:hypothetical protein
MIAIAIGYAWVWQVKTSRVVAEPVPALVLGPVTSSVPGHDRSAEIALRDSIAGHLLALPRIKLIAASEVGPPADDRQAQRVYGLTGSVRRAQDGQYHLELRRTDARTNSLVYTYRVRGATLSEAVHRMTVQVAMSFGLPRPVADTAATFADRPAGSDTAR